MEICETRAKIIITVDEKQKAKLIDYMKSNNFEKLLYYGKKPMSEREIEVLKLISEGKSNLQIGKNLNISKHTVKAHTNKIFEKLCVNNRVQATAKAVKMGLV